MIARSNWLVRQLRWIHPGRNPLVRPWDRIEAALVLLVLVLALAAIPFAALLGAEQREHALADSAEQQATRVHTDATLLTAAPDPGNSDVIPATSQKVAATWRLADGSVRVGTVDAAPGTPAGTPVSVWLDSTGNLTAPPTTAGNALSLGVGLGLLVWAGAVAALCLLLGLARGLLNRLRAAAWTREWARVGRDLNRF
ncbi:hypothetical protein FNH05_30895 [Amycolatopsis rhizosphaerae]|uniref:Transmembrane protein n=1 Tax=Amycolatopsis rhizosphaerae TaxID=2053003 RepID=A0A558ATF0_9PSEU|nr:hypothetical protein [Amycolatopsis rhizosphaerae]TVT27476.1 hypothetical protein FNH05_30895 [Amycolatopsis rhizosphaerae]